MKMLPILLLKVVHNHSWDVDNLPFSTSLWVIAFLSAGYLNQSDIAPRIFGSCKF